MNSCECAQRSLDANNVCYTRSLILAFLEDPSAFWHWCVRTVGITEVKQLQDKIMVGTTVDRSYYRLECPF